MILEATLLLQTSIDQKIARESERLVADVNQRFVEAERKEDERVKRLFEELLKISERDSWNH